MIQTAVCDDEPFYREKISSLVKQYFEKHDLDYAIHLYPSGEAFLARHENTVKYDVVFMDISMQALDGIQTAARCLPQ